MLRFRLIAGKLLVALGLLFLVSGIYSFIRPHPLLNPHPLLKLSSDRKVVDGGNIDSGAAPGFLFMSASETRALAKRTMLFGAAIIGSGLALVFMKNRRSTL